MIKVTVADIDRFLAEDDGQPIVMLNLLRFKADGGRQRYLDYLAMAGPIVARYGAEIIFAGDGATALCAEPDQVWDAVALVRYPKRATFVEMIADPAYSVADPIRMSALEEAVLQPINVMRL
ncbi:DUF1330 domain-containing protein [Agrobacterium pusense]|uniref:DUF1330 domain-containing protein n=1 Tax=Agrobacterium pusense TaxID=648995 RepID=UPI001C6F4C5C|nr:DUF1330 domain-containing protein [Agrobacterium pusense]MBW9070136.1 DUF1330 domain-containing protein [Agrobacterium pusense]MBW9085024.1 DUF1330 domain-containing protein [Agrobacterium pusense]MBW9125501.1 DUF1330 domain-containing protein [Agrobacterium pusense]MBW9137916.1 DUF1330 domain-containing protein [Agrobacterium pusense]